MPIKIERTEPKHTARSGLFLYAEFMKGFGVDRLILEYMPRPKSGRGYDPCAFIKPLSMTLYGGGACIEDMKEIREDAALRKASGIKAVPSSSAMGDWLKRISLTGGIEGMEIINKSIARKIILKDKRKTYTLIIDPTIIEAEKKDACMTYLGVKGYRPVIAVLKELDIGKAYQFKQGSDNGGRLDIIKKAFDMMPEGKRIEKVLLDSEYYTNEVMEYLTEKGVIWAIAADKDRAVKTEIEAIPDIEWKPFATREGKQTDREIAETIHTTNKGKEAFRMIVLRWKDRQAGLFNNSYNYHAIATSMIESNIEEVVWQYNERAYIESHIKEIKTGFSMEQMPSGDFGANALYFGIGIMTYNLFIAQKYWVMPAEWASKTIKSIRWLLIEAVGRVIERSRRIILKIAATREKYRIYLEMRERLCLLTL
ncbi:MAG: IS1380 family transposase [Bacteroidetes bacterium]|nr:IS1380 family transposase [Bacteroidota bacterium]